MYEKILPVYHHVDSLQADKQLTKALVEFEQM